MTYQHIELDHLAAALPNLEAFVSPEEAMEAKRELAHAADAILRMSNYAACKQHAMEDRLKGNIKRALSFEARADEHYKQLPDWAKW